jgi:hypothetical protein
LRKLMRNKVRELLETLSLEEVFEHLDITPEDVIEILLQGGYVVLPPWLDDEEENYYG